MVLALLVGILSSGAQAQERRQSAAELGETATQRIEIREGANIVSLHVAPSDPKLAVVLKGVLDKTLVVRNGAGQTYAPSHGIEDFDAWPWWEALHLYALEPFTLEVTGREITSASEIDLPAGWSQVPLFLRARTPVEDAFASIQHALTRVDDGEGRTYSTPDGGTLESLFPGAGYRVHLKEPAVLTYQPEESAPSHSVGSIEEMLALDGLQPSDIVEVADPVRGGVFQVTESGCRTDGGTCYVPHSDSEPTSVGARNSSVVLYDGPNDDGIAFESFRLAYGPGSDDNLDAAALHGHASGKGDDGGDPLFNAETGQLRIPSGLRDLAGDLTGSRELKASYRYATSALRLERSIEPVRLEGRRTTDYVRPEWWGAVSYPQNWMPDTSAPSGPRATPSGIASGDLTYDATDRLASAINAAEVAAAQTDREHYVVLGGMYGYARVIELQDRVVLKGEQDGVRDGQGLRVLKGAPWHYWAVKQGKVDPAYHVELTARDYLMVSHDPMVVLRHGRQSRLNRVVDIELDGNLLENMYIFDDEYMAASGESNGSWRYRVEEMLQNTPHWNGFTASHRHGDTTPGSNARLENVHAHDFGGNILLGGGEPIHFGGSRDLKLGNTIKNHHFYRIFTAEGTTVDGIEIYGFSWASHLEIQQGHYKNILFTNLVKNPQFGLGNLSPEVLIGHRNDAVPEDELFNPENPSYYFGDDARMESVRFELSHDFRPRSALISYDSGPLSITGVTVDMDGDRPVSIVNGGSTDSIDRSSFTLEDVVVERGHVRSFLAARAMVASARNVSSSSGTGGGEGVILNPFREGHVATFYDVGGGASGAGTWAPEVVKVRLQRDPDVTLDVFVQRARFTGVVLPVKAERLDPADPGVASRYRVFWRDVNLSRWRDTNNDRGTSRESGRLQYFQRVTVGDRRSEATGTLSSRSLTRASDGTRYVDVDPKLFYAPQDPTYVTVTGRDAGRFVEWEDVGDKYEPIIRLTFSGTAPVSAGWTAAIRPIPSDVTFPE